MLFQPACKICGQTCATIEVIAAHEQPMKWTSWNGVRQELFRKHRVPASPYLLYAGPGGSNGWVGDAIDEEEAAAIVAAFTDGPTAAKIRAAGFYDGAGMCDRCEEFYCRAHWSISNSGFGRCPKGHGKSLDPHWHPDN